MEIFIYIISLLIILSKYLDCYTTSSQITSITQEKNPLARKFMRQFGVHTTIWAIFGLTIIIVVLSVWLISVYYNTTTHKVIFIFLGMMVSIAQFAVAHTNKTKQLNFITKLILKFY